MRIEPVPPTAPAGLPAGGTPAANASPHHPVTVTEDGDVWQPGTDTATGTSVLLVLIQGILEQLAGHPVTLNQPFATDANRGDGYVPSWISPALHALGQPGHGALDIEVHGHIVAQDSEQPFVLSMQMLNLFQIHGEAGFEGQFTPVWADEGHEGAEVIYTLHVRADAGEPAVSGAGSPLIAHCTLGDAPGVHHLAARLLPVATPQSPARNTRHGEAGFATPAALAVADHHLDTCA
jgi:hypothetical protein